MRPGRQPAWRLDGVPAGIFVEAVAVDERGRVSLGLVLGHGPSWFVAGAELLAVLGEEPGRVRLLPLNAAERVTNRLGALATQLENGDEAVIGELQRLVDRYRRVRIGPDGRLGLPLAIGVHLSATSAGQLLVAASPAHMELWSTAFRSAQLAERDPSDGLP